MPDMLTRPYRFLLLLLVSFLFLFVGAFPRLVPFLDRESRRRLAAHAMTLGARTICAIFGVRVSVQGAPRGLNPSFVVCNHSGYLDIPVLGSVLLAVFVSKHEVRRWPLIGWLASLAGTVYVDREAKRDALNALNEIREAIADGVDVIVFPEGTTTNGLEMKSFKSTLFDAPATLGVSVLPVSIKYTAVDARKIGPDDMDLVAWHGNQPLLPHVWRLLGHRRIDAVVYLNASIACPSSEGSRSQLRKDLAVRTQEEIRKGLELVG